MPPLFIPMSRKVCPSSSLMRFISCFLSLLSFASLARRFLTRSVSSTSSSIASIRLLVTVLPLEKVLPLSAFSYSRPTLCGTPTSSAKSGLFATAFINLCCFLDLLGTNTSTFFLLGAA